MHSSVDPLSSSKTLLLTRFKIGCSQTANTLKLAFQLCLDSYFIDKKNLWGFWNGTTWSKFLSSSYWNLGFSTKCTKNINYIHSCLRACKCKNNHFIQIIFGLNYSPIDLWQIDTKFFRNGATKNCLFNYSQPDLIFWMKFRKSFCHSLSHVLLKYPRATSLWGA